MMNRFWLLIGLVLLFPRSTWGQSTCQECLLGVYDDRAMTRTTGTMSAFQTKTVYVGIRLGGPVSGLATLDLRATYPSGFTLLDVTSFIPNTRITPSSSNRVKVEWPACVRASQALFAIRFISFSPVRDAVVQVQDAVLGSCPGGTPPSWRIPGGCYILNPSAGRPPCSTAVEPSTWGAMKELFR